MIAISEHSKNTRDSAPEDAELFISDLEVIQDEELRSAAIAAQDQFTEQREHSPVDQGTAESDAKGAGLDDGNYRQIRHEQDFGVMDGSNEKGADGSERRYRGMV